MILFENGHIELLGSVLLGIDPVSHDKSPKQQSF